MGLILKPRFLIAISLVLLVQNVQKSEGIFRFCYGGSWHELQENDCPYGLLFNQIIETPCFYTLGIDNTTARIWPTVCDNPFVNDKEDHPAIVGDDFILAQKNGQIQLVQYGITEPAGNLPIWDDVVDMATCQDQCYISIDTDNVPLGTSHEEGDSNELDHGVGIVDEIDETQKMSITDQTLRLGDFLFDELNEANPNKADLSGPDLRIVKIFKKTLKILGKTCPDPFIPEDFRNRILSGFLFLVADTGVGEMDDIDVGEFEDIMGALKTCEDKYPTFRIEGTVCSMKTVANQIIKILPDGGELSAIYRPAEMKKNLTQFPYKLLDPFTEFAWQAVTVAHASCFANFKPNANMHHKYTAAMERLFGEKIRFRWQHPTQLEDTRMWGTWFLADVDSTHLNFGACISGAYEGAPFSMKLDRPIDETRRSGRRKKRDVEREDIGSYWAQYRSGGGIKNKLLGQAQCFDSQERRDFVVNNIKLDICPDAINNTNSGTIDVFENNGTTIGEVTTEDTDGVEITTENIDGVEVTTDNVDGNEVTTESTDSGEATTENTEGVELTTENTGSGEATTENADSGETTTENIDEVEVTTEETEGVEVATEHTDSGEATTESLTDSKEQDNETGTSDD